MKPLEGIGVLLIEADPLGAKLAGLVLRDAGAEVAVAFDAEQALRQLDALRPRVVVIDLELPVVSGLVLARHISQLTWAQATPIIGLSTGPGRQSRLDALSSGCSGYVEKPINECLVEAVVHSLGDKR